MVTKADINMRFVKAIESLLQDKGLTKTGVAQSLGIKPAKFSEILNFRMNVGTETIALNGVCEMFLTLMQDKDLRANELAEEIGQLKAQVRQLTIEKERLAASAQSSNTANVG